MDQQDFGRAFGFNEEALISPPPTTITSRRKGKIPRSPIPQPMLQSTEQPTEPPTDTPSETDEDTYDDDEQGTPTPIRKRPSANTRIPDTETSTTSLIDALIAQNQRAEESNRQMMAQNQRTEESNKQMIQSLMQTISHLTTSRSTSRPPSPTQPIANSYDPTIQQIKQLSEKSKLVRPMYVKVRLAKSRDWAKWKVNIFEYMICLQMPDILSASCETSTKKTSKYAIYDIQNILLILLILKTVE